MQQGNINGVEREYVGYEESFIEGGGVGLILKYSDSRLDEPLRFFELSDVEKIALSHPKVPLEVWGLVYEMLAESIAFHQQEALLLTK